MNINLHLKKYVLVLLHSVCIPTKRKGGSDDEDTVSVGYCPKAVFKSRIQVKL